MSDSRQMPKIRPADYEKLDDIQKMYMKKVENQNISRVSKYVGVRSKKRKIGIFIGLFAVSVYAYTIYAIKQEKLGDEYDQRITDTPQAQSADSK